MGVVKHANEELESTIMLNAQKRLHDFVVAVQLHGKVEPVGFGV
jgi:hypothetical protein